MNISRSNYEMWFLDRLDGKLDDSQARELELFLWENPDLREELDELAGMRLYPPDLHFKGKGKLLKSAGDISAKQFEWLCAASLENDLSPDQQNELRDLISGDIERQKTFDLISRMKIAPPPIVFPHKKKLLRRTPTQKIIRLSVMVLSAAALIALVLLYGPLRPGTKYELNSTGDRISKANNKESIPQRIIKKKEESLSGIKEKSTAPHKNVTNVTISAADSIHPAVNSVHETPVEKVYFNKRIELPAEHPSVSLAASPAIPNPEEPDQSFPDNRSNVGRFLARNFRQKIMKENMPDDRPLKSYEIAEAGVSGLNRLFGWDMALNENTDAQGQVKSVRFSSKLIKFNAPVKNSSYPR